ncbi:conjugative transposon protein TraK [Solirubrum puertoriconensis]|uniref:Conjugal transfer protein n=1 Tax=Solirubrum puertoriconensis TaxID=1751427 RepID=A0A9X0L5S7_SOLP1|nr:conjugative transposon protein TraK [Solirubrum puertoriconensis]KUG09068.1 conjugal transfer protein [Solirubrum puertoriconensis]
MLRSLKNVDTAFQQVKTLALVFGVLCLLLTGFTLFACLRAVSAAQNRVYLLADGQLLTAAARDVRDNRPVEAREHVRRFHELFFTLDPDEKAIEDNVGRALYLADASARRMYDNLREKGYYNDLIAANISQKLRVDSVVVDRDARTARCYATQQIIRTSSVTTRNLVSECTLRPVTRSENNPHGFLMERWRVLHNQDLRTEPR